MALKNDVTLSYLAFTTESNQTTTINSALRVYIAYLLINLNKIMLYLLIFLKINFQEGIKIKDAILPQTKLNNEPYNFL